MTIVPARLVRDFAGLVGAFYCAPAARSSAQGACARSAPWPRCGGRCGAVGPAFKTYRKSSPLRPGIDVTGLTCGHLFVRVVVLRRTLTRGGESMGAKRPKRQRQGNGTEGLGVSDTLPPVTAGRPATLPKDAMRRVQLGQSFAEYDAALSDPSVYVHTSALQAASDPLTGKFFFVGRRGTGKTAIRRYLDSTLARTVVVVPGIFSPSGSRLDLQALSESSKKPFRSLVAAFRRTLQDEILFSWREVHPHYVDIPPTIQAEIDTFGDLDFDARTLRFIDKITAPLADGDDEGWLAENKIVKTMADEMKALNPNGAPGEYTLLIDSIDDFWDASPYAILYLTAFMHACLEMSTQIPWTRALLFVRENIFERVRAVDSESSRLETAIVALDWTKVQLVELVERRLNRSFMTKLGLNGQTWDAFFADPNSARSLIFDYCQSRPRDVLIYTSYAIESAQGSNHTQVLPDDILGARRRFSDNRLKDLGDEYSENFPQIAIVLSRFYGLGRRYTVGGIEAFIRKLLRDQEVKRLCAEWIYQHQASEVFIRLLYNIGFLGLENPRKEAQFRTLGPRDTSPPPLTHATTLVIHRSYWDALDLQDVLIRSLQDEQEFGRLGLLTDLPGNLDETQYVERLEELLAEIQVMPKGAGHAAAFEDFVGEVIKLCFFRALDNVEPKVRDVDGKTIRDWVAANRASAGFWEMMRVRYNATQVTWECKNYDTLSAEDFHQASYYMSEAGGRFSVMVFRGDVRESDYRHLLRVSRDDGMILLLGERDLKVFLRQAKNGKIKEDHIQNLYDNAVRRVS